MPRRSHSRTSRPTSGIPPMLEGTRITSSRRAAAFDRAVDPLDPGGQERGPWRWAGWK
jgi:hypothetical protein